jgi:hypothetical protein
MAKACRNNGTSCQEVQVLCFWTLAMVLISFKTTYSASETGFCLHLWVEPTQLGPIDTTSPYLHTPAPTQERIYKPSTT